MTSPAEQALQETTNVPSEAWRAQRAQYVSQAVSLMNQLASEMKAIPTKINWSGPSRDAAEQRFVQYSAQVTQHADTLAAVDKADAQAAEAVTQAQQDYINLPDGQLSPAQADAANKDANFHPGAKDANAQNAEMAEARRQKAEADKQKLDSSMGSADSDLRSNVSWDFGDIDRGGRQGDGDGGYTPAPGSAPGGGGGSGNSGSVWGQGGQTPTYYNPNGPGEYIVQEGPGFGPPPTTTGIGGGYPVPPGGYQTPVNVDGSTTGTTGGVGGGGGYGGGFGGLGGSTGGTTGGGGMGGMAGGVGGVAGAGGIVAGGAGLAAGGLRAAGGAGGRFGSAGRAGASADGGLSGKTTGTGAGGRGGMGGAPGEAVGSSGAAGGGRPGGMMGGGGGGGGAGGGRGGISGASSGKYGVPKLGAEGGRGAAGGGRGGASGAAGAGGRGSGKGEDRDGERTFLTEEDEENWYDGVVDDE